MREEIKEKINQVTETILDRESYHIEILNINNVLDKIVPVFETIYNIVPYKHIFVPRMGFHILTLPFETKAFRFALNVSEKGVNFNYFFNRPKWIYNKTEWLREEENRVVVCLDFFPHFGKEYNPIAVKFIPDDVKDLRIYMDETYFAVPLEVKITKYDLI